MIRPLSLVALAAATLVTAPTAVAQTDRGRADMTSPSQLGVTATTPSRMERSRREMNRGRTSTWLVNMTPSQTRTYAERALRRGGFICAVAEAVTVGQTNEGAPLVEVDCVDGGGLVIADTDPVMAVDCLDLIPGSALTRETRLDACRLPANVASVAADRNSPGPRQAGGAAQP